jgi:hypothetical protein
MPKPILPAPDTQDRGAGDTGRRPFAVFQVVASERRIPVKRTLSIIVAGLMVCMFVACLPEGGNAFASDDEADGLPLSDMQVKITSRGHTATFRLYDTVAARAFHDQLPLKLDLTNSRDAQWMFYPPEKLNFGKRAYKRNHMSFQFFIPTRILLPGPVCCRSGNDNKCATEIYSLSGL